MTPIRTPLPPIAIVEFVRPAHIPSALQIEREFPPPETHHGRRPGWLERIRTSHEKAIIGAVAGVAFYQARVSREPSFGNQLGSLRDRQGAGVRIRWRRGPGVLSTLA